MIYSTRFFSVHHVFVPLRAVAAGNFRGGTVMMTLAWLAETQRRSADQPRFVSTAVTWYISSATCVLSLAGWSNVTPSYLKASDGQHYVLS